MKTYFGKTACAAILLASAGGQAMAGYVYEATTSMGSNQGGGRQETRVKGWVEGESARIEFEESGGMGFMEPGTYLITRNAGETMLFVNPEKKTYSELNLGETMQAAGAVMQQMGGMLKMEYKDISVEKVLEEPGPEILGYDTVHTVVNSGYTQSMSIMGQEMNQKNVMKSEMWTTSKIDASAFSVWMRPDQRFKGMIEGLDEYMQKTFSQISGTPLRVVVNTTTTDNNGRSYTSEMETNVTYVSEEDVDEARFEIPADYEKIDMAASMSGESGDAGDQKFDMSKMKDLFKNKKGN